jgi:hypothetical protein
MRIPCNVISSPALSPPLYHAKTAQTARFRPLSTPSTSKQKTAIDRFPDRSEAEVTDPEAIGGPRSQSSACELQRSSPEMGINNVIRAVTLHSANHLHPLHYFFLPRSASKTSCSGTSSPTTYSQ